MISYFLEVTLCWTIFYGFFALFLSRTTFFKINRFYLLGAILLGLVIPFIELSLEQGTPEVLTFLQPISVGVENLEAAVSKPSSNQGIDFRIIFFLLYGIGALAFAARFIFGLWQIQKLYKQGVKEKHENFTLIKTPTTHLPFSFFSYLFWSDRFTLEKEFSEIVVKHEQAHIKGWHSLDVLFLESLCVLFWFNPFIHLYRLSLRNTHEYLADQLVLKTTQHKKYGHLLLRQSQSGFQVALANHFIRSQLKNRIAMITRMPSPKTTIWRYILVMPILLFLFLSFTSRELIEPSSVGVQQVGKDTIPAEELIFRKVEEMPRFPGCEETDGDKFEKKACADKKMLEFVQANIQYPAIAKEKGIEGTVIIQFIVDKQGVIQDGKIIRDIGAGCGEEALRVVNLMNEKKLRWTPGSQRGRVVNIELTLPVEFKLPDN